MLKCSCTVYQCPKCKKIYSANGEVKCSENKTHEPHQCGSNTKKESMFDIVWTYIWGK